MKIAGTAKHASSKASPGSKARRGAAAVELALVLPVMITMLLGAWDIGRLVDVYQILTNAAREGGRCASTGQLSSSQIQQAILNYMTQAGLPTTGVVATVTNLTNSSNTDPTAASQLDQFQISVSIPSNNVRWILLNNLIGSATLQTSCTWNSMNDIPLTVSSTIPAS